MRAHTLAGKRAVAKFRRSVQQAFRSVYSAWRRARGSVSRAAGAKLQQALQALRGGASIGAMPRAAGKAAAAVAKAGAALQALAKAGGFAKAMVAVQPSLARVVSGFDRAIKQAQQALAQAAR